MSLLLVSVLASALGAAPSSPDPRLSILDAMSEELERNRTRLKLGENAPPYFISYAVKDLTQSYVAARYGAHLRRLDQPRPARLRRRAGGQLRARQLDQRGARLQLLPQGHQLQHPEGGAARRRPHRAPDHAVADHRREVQGRPLQPPQEEGRGGLRGGGSEEASLLQPREAQHLRRPRGGLHLRQGAVDGAGAQALRPLQPGGEDLRHRRARHRRQGGPLLRQLGRLAHRDRADLLRGAPLRGHPRRRRAAAGRLPRLLRASASRSCRATSV